ELGTRWQAAVPQQVADLLEGGRPGEIVDVVPTIGEHTAVAVDVAQRRGRGDHVLQAWRSSSHGANRLLPGRLRAEHRLVAAELLHERHQAGVEEADLEED